MTYTKKDKITQCTTCGKDVIWRRSKKNTWYMTDPGYGTNGFHSRTCGKDVDLNIVHGVKCKFCKVDGLHWERRGWYCPVEDRIVNVKSRLVDSEGYIHDCR